MATKVVDGIRYNYIHGNYKPESHIGTGAGDLIQAEGGNDTLYGYGGNDRLEGGIGKDIIYGGTGNDIIKGGPGKDVLYGEQGADRFVLSIVGDSKGTEWDVIKDFDPSAGDKIDLHEIDALSTGVSGNQAFNFGTGPGLGYVWTERVGNDLFIKGINHPHDSESHPSFLIELDNFSGTLSASDFFL